MRPASPPTSRRTSRSRSSRLPDTTSSAIARTRSRTRSSAARLPAEEAPGMRVVYTPAHLAHDVVTETVMGGVIPANEVPERAERIRTALEADGGFAFEPPTEHGTEPILAVHDAGLLR